MPFHVVDHTDPHPARGRRMLADHPELRAEHHDLPAMPWNRLPEVRRRAPEAYVGRVDHRSWTWLWLRFLFDPRLSLASRAVRSVPR